MAARRQVRSAPTVRSRAWLEWRGGSALGQGRLALLEALGEQHSISGAARAIGVSYRAAWRWIDAMNQIAGQPLVETRTGGRDGGGASLTPTGAAVIEAARRLNAELAEFNQRMDQELGEFFASLSPRR